MESFYPFKREHKWGFIDKEGNKIIHPQYTFGAFSTEGLAIAQKNGCCGFINFKNDIVIPFCYDTVNQIHEGAFYSSGKGLFDINNNCLFPFKDGDLSPFFHNGFACITSCKRKESGLLARSGDWIIKPQDKLRFLFTVESGLVAVHSWTESLAGFINTSGEVVIPMTFLFVHSFSENLASVRGRTPFGFIDLNGDYVIPPLFDDAAYFSEGYAAVGITRRSTKYGFINKAGEFVIPPKYSGVGPFNAGCAPVLHERKCGLINTAGEFILEPYFKEIEHCSDGIFKVIDKQDNLGYI